MPGGATPTETHHTMWPELSSAVRRGDARAIGRFIRAVDDRLPGAEEALDALGGPRPTVVGITGPPGAGKSTLLGRLAELWRPVGLVAVDPSSPFSGGALLGDRLRFSAVAREPGVQAVSLASRGALGGLSRATEAAVRVLGAAGYPRVLVETVGVGQSEVEVATLADVTCVVLVPGLGDGVQAMKAGLLEIADVFALNKADRPGARRLASELDVAVDHIFALRGVRPERVSTEATAGRGVSELAASIDRAVAQAALLDPRERARRRLFALALDALHDRLAATPGEPFVDSVVGGRSGPYAAARAWAEAAMAEYPGRDTPGA